MAECPQCHSSIQIPEQNFGTLFTCPACNAVYFVGWDGIPEQPENPLAAALEDPVSAAAFPTEFPTDSPSEKSNDSFQAASYTESPSASSLAVHVDATPDFKDVVEFGNSPQLEGSLTYTIFIKGIDIADTREKIKEALTDTRFAWDVERLMSQINNGAIVLPDLSPAKAVVLINRIKYLPIELRWNQNVLS